LLSPFVLSTVTVISSWVSETVTLSGVVVAVEVAVVALEVDVVVVGAAAVLVVEVAATCTVTGVIRRVWLLLY